MTRLIASRFPDLVALICGLLVLPWILGVLIFQAYPFISSFIFSFSKYNIATFRWIGLENYKRLFTIDQDIINCIKVTFGYVFITVPGKLVIAMIVALILNQKLKAINLVRTIYYIPSLMGGSIAVAILWKLMFMSDGAINSLLAIIGIQGPNWLGNPSTALPTICLLEIWQFGSSMLIFLSALKQIPFTLYESAMVDGAKPSYTFFRITLPMLTPTIFFNLILQIINGFRVFTESYVITDGGPLDSTLSYVLYLYRRAFTYFDMGYSCALAWILVAIIAVFTVIIFKTQKNWVYYESEEG